LNEQCVVPFDVALEFDDNAVDCERDKEFVVFVKVGDVFDERDCGIVVELVIVVGEPDIVGEVEDDSCIEVGGRFGRGISKISTTSEYPLELYPPPKNILFVDDVDTR
jgi:hypothetical protein